MKTGPTDLYPLAPERLTVLWLLFSAAIESLLFGTSLIPGHLSYHTLVSNVSPLSVTPFKISHLWHFSVCWRLGTASCRNNGRVKDESYRSGLGVWEPDGISVRSVSVVYLGREGKERKASVWCLGETEELSSTCLPRKHPSSQFWRVHQIVASWTGHKNLAQMHSSK